MSSIRAYMTAREVGPERPVTFRDLLNTIGLGLLSCLGGAAPATGVSYSCPSISSLSVTQALRQIIVPVGVRVTALYLVTTGAQPGDGAMNLYLQKNGVDTAMAATVAAAGAAGSFSDTLASHAVDFAAGDLLGYRYENLSASAGATIGSHAVAVQ